MTDLADLRALSVEERLKLIEDLWDSIDTTVEALPLPDWHRAEINRRFDGLVEGTSAGAPWPDVYRRIIGKS